MLERQEKALPAPTTVTTERADRHSQMPGRSPGVRDTVVQNKAVLPRGANKRPSRNSATKLDRSNLEGLSNRKTVKRNPNVKGDRLEGPELQRILNVCTNRGTAGIKSNVCVRRKCKRTPARENSWSSSLANKSPCGSWSWFPRSDKHVMLPKYVGLPSMAQTPALPFCFCSLCHIQFSIAFPL